MSDEKQGGTGGAAAAKQRNPLERVIVWGLIGILLIVMAVEGSARLGYSGTFNSLTEALKESENDDEKDVSFDSFKSDLLSGFAKQTDVADRTFGGGKIYKYEWVSLFKKYEMDIIVSSDDVVLGFETPDAPAEEIAQKGDQKEAEVDPDVEAGMQAAMMGAGGPGGGGPGPGGPGGGGPGFGGPGGGEDEGEGGGRVRGPRGPRGLLGQVMGEEAATALNLSDEQKTQVAELVESRREVMSTLRGMPAEQRLEAIEMGRRETEEKLKEILNDQQYQQARQGMLKSQGLAALLTDEVAAALELNDEQKTGIEELVNELNEDLAAIREDAQGEGLSAEEVAQLTKESTDLLTARAHELLSEEQRAKWKALIGEE